MERRRYRGKLSLPGAGVAAGRSLERNDCGGGHRQPGRVRVADRWLDGHIIVSPDRIIEPWQVHEPANLTLADLEPAIELQPEIVLLGTGAKLKLSDVELMSALASLRIGLEVMSTPAACRTFNVLVHERRRVVAALLNFPGF